MSMRHQVAAARLWAANKFPYLASGLFATTIIELPDSRAFAVDDSWRLYVDPKVIEGWTVEELGGMLVHHTGHLLRDHAGRAETLGLGHEDAKAWTLAADMEINDDLRDVKMPGDPVLPSSHGQEDGRLAEEYFRAVRTEDGDAADHGSGTDSMPRDWDLPGQMGGMSQSEAQLLRCQVAGECLRAGKEPGKVPAGMLRWATEMLNPKVDWRKALAAEIRSGIADVSGRVDYTYRRPSRRQSVMGDVIMPALRKPIPDVAVVVDTSGSMDANTLGQAIAEVEGLLRTLSLRADRLRVLSCDAAVHTVQKVSNARQITLQGGGGTNMGAGIDAAMKLKPKPSVVIVLTDAFTPWPAEGPKGARVVVGVLGGGGYEPPSWARTIRIDDVGRV